MQVHARKRGRLIQYLELIGEAAALAAGTLLAAWTVFTLLLRLLF